MAVKLAENHASSLGVTGAAMESTIILGGDSQAVSLDFVVGAGELMWRMQASGTCKGELFSIVEKLSVSTLCRLEGHCIRR